MAKYRQVLFVSPQSLDSQLLVLMSVKVKKKNNVNLPQSILSLCVCLHLICAVKNNVVCDEGEKMFLYEHFCSIIQ